MSAPSTIRPPIRLKVIKIGNSAGVILPKDVLTKLGVAAGDGLSVTETPSGLTAARSDPGFEEQISVAREVSERRRGALRALAK